MASLADLPIETLYNIARQLSPRSLESPENGHDGLNIARYAKGLAALSRLSRTCKQLRAIVQPILFHSVVDSDETSLSLITTLNARPDLARAVVEMEVHGRHLPCSRDADESLSASEQSMMSELLAKNFQTETQQPPTVQGNVDDLARCNVFAGVVISLAPNIKRLLVHVYYWDLPVFKPGSLPCLRELYIKHVDTEMGLHLSRFQSLLQAAPALQILKCHMVSTVDSAISHENLTTLTLKWSVLTNESFELLIDGLPKLESFSYSSGGSLVNDAPEASPRQIFEAVNKRRSTLKHLHIDLQESVYMDEPGEEDTIPSLAGLEVLQTLKISALALAEADEPTDGNVLVDALPRSIRSFTLFDPHDTMAEDINRLAEIASERFPHLKEVCFYNSSNQPREVPETPFTSRGIKCTNKAPFCLGHV
ncbi:hypothetical protein HDV63DRAFT_362832 [Trichoderma sp. SZMC 28014]